MSTTGTLSTATTARIENIDFYPEDAKGFVRVSFLAPKNVSWVTGEYKLESIPEEKIEPCMTQADEALEMIKHAYTTTQ